MKKPSIAARKQAAMRRALAFLQKEAGRRGTEALTEFQVKFVGGDLRVRYWTKNGRDKFGHSAMFPVDHPNLHVLVRPRKVA